MTVQIECFSGKNAINDANKWLSKNKDLKIRDVRIETSFSGVLVYIVYEY